MKIIPSSRRCYYAARVSIFLVTVALIVGTAGCGSTPIQINDWYDLDAVRDNPGGSYILMNDLDSATPGYEQLAGPTANGGKGWEPIGIWDRTSRFTGTLDGQGYEIRDLFIARSGEDYVGLFGTVDGTGVIRNVGVVNADVSGGDYRVGALIGSNWGSVLNCYSTGSVSGGQWVGGLVGLNDGRRDIVPAAAIIDDSYSAASVSGNQSGIGGLLGYNGAGTLSRSYSTGNVTGQTRVGGLVGLNFESTVSKCYSTGNVTGNSSVGGLVGYIFKGTVNNSYSTGNVTGNSHVGGLVGYTEEDLQLESYFPGRATGDVKSEGPVGLNEETIVSNSFWDTETSGQSTSDGGTGKNTTEMKNITTFSGATWNIVAVANPSTRNLAYTWNIVSNVTYPFLNWQS